MSLALDRLPAPVLSSLRWPGRPDLPGGNPAWTYMVRHPFGEFALFVGELAREGGGPARRRVHAQVVCAEGPDGDRLKALVRELAAQPTGSSAQLDLMLAPANAHLIRRHAPRNNLSRYPVKVPVIADRLSKDPIPGGAAAKPLQQLLDTTGHHVQERRLVRTPFTPGTRLRESWEGRPGHDAVTWLAAGPTGFGWRSGRVHGVHAAWSGNVRHLAMNPASGRKLLGAGELLLPGEVSLAPGQTYTSPWTVFSWGEGLDALAQRSHAWLRSLPSTWR